MIPAATKVIGLILISIGLGVIFYQTIRDHDGTVRKREHPNPNKGCGTVFIGFIIVGIGWTVFDW